MRTVGVSAENQQSVFRQVSAILWMSKLEFTQDASDISHVTEGDALTKVSELLGCDPVLVNKAVTTRTVNVSGRSSMHVTPLNAEEARVTCVTMAKALYSKIFDWLVATINTNIKVEGDMGATIGILDIYGFEIFETNSFEQLCINYVNEKLQQVSSICAALL